MMKKVHNLKKLMETNIALSKEAQTKVKGGYKRIPSVEDDYAQISWDEIDIRNQNNNRSSNPGITTSGLIS